MTGVTLAKFLVLMLFLNLLDQYIIAVMHVSDGVSSYTTGAEPHL